MKYNKLLLSWKGPESKTNYLVGVLEKRGSNYLFYYNQLEVGKAAKEGFKPFIGLSDTYKKYKSDKPEFRKPIRSRLNAGTVGS